MRLKSEYKKELKRSIHDFNSSIGTIKAIFSIHHPEAAPC